MYEDVFFSPAGLASLVNLNRPYFLTGMLFMNIIDFTLVKRDIKISSNF